MSGFSPATGTPLSKLRLHFGKYDGKLISDVPADYLEWMVEKKAQYWNFARDELARRERGKVDA